MLNKIRIGKYIAIDSLVHRMHPVSKLLGSILFIGSILCINNWRVLFIYAIFICLLTSLSNISYRYYLQNIWSMRILFISIFVLNLLVGVPLLENSILLSTMILIVIDTALILYTTSIQDLIYAFSICIFPLRVFKIPTEVIAFSLGLSISFIPSILEQSDRILKSLKSRGIHLRQLKGKNKLLGFSAITIPIFERSFMKADALAQTMELRGYTLAHNSRKYSYKFNYYDICYFIFHIVLIILVYKEGIL